MEPQQMIRRPLISEKSTRLKETTNTICFEVDAAANKIEIAKRRREALRRQGGAGARGQPAGEVEAHGEVSWDSRKAWKKAYVRLAAGEKPIEFFEGV